MLVGDTIGKRRRTGIQRVVIETARGLAGTVRFDLVRWDMLEGRLRFLDLAELNGLFGPGDWPAGLTLRPEARRIGRPFHEQLEDPRNTWILAPEVGWHEPHGVEAMARSMAHCRNWGGRFAAIFYDLIPIRNPVYSGGAEQHEAYLAELTRSDLIIPISQTAGEDLAALLRERGISPQPPIMPLLLPDGGFGGSRPRPESTGAPNRKIAMFGTVEPRKRQIDFLKAFEAARRSSPETARWHVVVVGSLHHAVAKTFKGMVQHYDWLTHHDYLSDATLAQIIDASDFTVFASEDEGYGLPISESLAAGVPCLCADFGSMAEIAAGGGCLAVDVRDSAALKEAVIQLCEDRSVLAELRSEIQSRPLKSWTDYAVGLAQILAGRDRGTEEAPVRVETAPASGALDDLAFRRLAEADIACFPDTDTRDEFIADARRRRWPALLPATALAADAEAASALLSRQRSRRHRVAEMERVYAKARQSINPARNTRQIFLRVLISTFNRRDFIVSNVRWILGKVFANAEVAVDLVVVDGGSTDGTVERLYKVYDPRFRIIECPANVGMLAGIREAARAPGAEYVWLVGDDDFIDPNAFREIVRGLRSNAGVPFAFTNFAVYQRAAFSPTDIVPRLFLEGRLVAENVAASGLLPVREAAAQTDNLFTAIYTIVWRADLLSAAYEHAFDGTPFESLTESIPCTEFILREYADCNAYWHAGVGIVGNAHNSWSRHRPRWHGVIMPMALSLAREAGVDPSRLQAWADAHLKLLDEARRIADGPDWVAALAPEHQALALRVFRTRPQEFCSP